MRGGGFSTGGKLKNVPALGVLQISRSAPSASSPLRSSTMPCGPAHRTGSVRVPILCHMVEFVCGMVDTDASSRKHVAISGQSGIGPWFRTSTRTSTRTMSVPALGTVQGRASERAQGRRWDRLKDASQHHRHRCPRSVLRWPRTGTSPKTGPRDPIMPVTSQRSAHAVWVRLHHPSIAGYPRCRG